MAPHCGPRPNSAIAQVVALRETSVVFAACIGSLFLGERFGARRIAASIVVAAGLVLLSSAQAALFRS